MADIKDDPQMLILVSGENEKFQLRKEQLEKHSDYFKGLFHSGMKECHSESVHLPALSSAGLNATVRMMEEEEVNLSWDTVSDVLCASTYLQILHLTEECCTFLKNELRPSNISHVKKLASQFFLNGLSESVENFILTNLKEISATNEFVNWSHQTLCGYLDSDDLFVKEEKDAFDIAITWLSCKTENRQYARGVLDTIRFPLIPKAILRECCETLTAMDLTSCTQEYIDGALDSYSPCWNPSRKCQARCMEDCVLALGGFTTSEHSTNRFQMVPLEEIKAASTSGNLHGNITFRSYKETKLPVTLCEHGACELNGFVYVAGGQTQYCQNGKYTRNSVHRYDPRFNSWLEVSSMSTPRSLFYLGVLDGQLYAVGGWRGPNMVTKGVECYNPSKDSWHTVAALGLGLHEHAGCTHEGALYISGGYKGPMQGHLNKMFCYDKAANQWNELAPMNNSRSYHAMVSLSGCGVLVAGGVNYLGEEEFEDVRSCELYDPCCNHWTIVTQCPRFACCMPALVIDSHLYLFGGHSFHDSSDHHMVQILDTTTCEWKEATLESNRILCFGCVSMKIPRQLSQHFYPNK